MFSGITEIKMPIKKIANQKGNLLAEIKKPLKWKLKVGESVLVDGICSTIIKTGANFKVEYMPETLSKTNIGERKIGDNVNLERSLKLNDLLSGHLVTGHIDLTGRVKKIKNSGNSKVIEFSVDKKFAKYLVNKGSVAVNGVSLTVVKAGNNSFSVSLIPHTLKITNLGGLKIGDTVNLEFDVIAKYLERLIK